MCIGETKSVEQKMTTSLRSYNKLCDKTNETTNFMKFVKSFDIIWPHTYKTVVAA